MKTKAEVSEFLPDIIAEHKLSLSKPGDPEGKDTVASLGELLGLPHLFWVKPSWGRYDGGA